MDKRQERRVMVTDQVSFEGKSGAGQGITFNLSINGCAFESAQAVAPDATLQLEISIPTQKNPVKVNRAKVTWKAGNGMGVQFLNMDETAKARLRQYIDGLPQQPSGKGK